METRTRTFNEVRVYKLILNPMSDRAEAGKIVAISDDYNKLVEWYKAQFATGAWRDEDGWWRTFRKDSPLFWMNPCNSVELNPNDIFHHGIYDELVGKEDYSSVFSSGRFYVV